MYSRHPLPKSLSEVMDRLRPLCLDTREHILLVASHPQKKNICRWKSFQQMTE